jgi:hypothetical protein
LPALDLGEQVRVAPGGIRVGDVKELDLDARAVASAEPVGRDERDLLLRPDRPSAATVAGHRPLAVDPDEYRLLSGELHFA